MSKGRRNRARRRDQPPRPRLISSVEEIDGQSVMPDMPCRLTFLDDPVLGGGRPATGINPDGTLITDQTGTIEPLPVVLFEPPQAMMATNRVTGLTQELRIEGVIANGFCRVPAAPAWVLQPAEGWEVRRVPEGLVLRDGSGDVWARSPVTLDPAWVSAATSYRSVVVFFGPQLGVRAPPGMSPAAYTTAMRAAEFKQARKQGLAAGATVAWRGEPASETLEWVTFLPGSFGLPYAGIFAPAVAFTVHGGPEMFGLAQLRDQNMAVSPEPIGTVAARVSRTDIDLIDPDAEGPETQLGGVHYPEGVHAAWRQAAATHQKVLLLTGRQLPAPDAPRSSDNRTQLERDFGELWAAIVPVRIV
jgi:hypothetical protein